ncbi:DUF2834 domain-containing protein [Pseudomonas putida SJTE-1]|jgi:hypothetical protein|nr:MULTISPECIES: hypothetical protein [Pseudomonas]ANI03998.1 DUF2834 domain-containing protein [Pseudomonas putida SJTE-1]MBX6689489.1 DUF2834 domain-containing protein [Pseudomonas sp. USTB-Z]MDD2000599.1 DUF2834 domain-containing protein [Pseudomonas putida]MEB3439577.1 DUF2834 domain-containing protein [Pseudomonas sp. A2]POA84207.1 DUF2834 domain-containing protein [Pseudomonas sp. FW305-E2]
MGLRICALAILVLFSLYTGWTMLIAEQSLLAFGLALLAQPDTAQVVTDLYLMAGLAGCWMVRDNRMRASAGIAVLPYLLLTVVFVSLGPLLYLVIRGVAEGRQP